MSAEDELVLPKNLAFLVPYVRLPQRSQDDESSLDFGEWHSLSDAGSQVRQKALRLFLQAIDLVAPEVRQSLIDDVRPLYQQAYCRSDQDRRILDFGALQALIDEERASIRETALYDGLCSWAKTHKLTTDDLSIDVILDAALYTLSSWPQMETLYRDVFPYYRPVASKKGSLIDGEQAIYTDFRDLVPFVKHPPPAWKIPIGKLTSWLKEHRGLNQDDFPLNLEKWGGEIVGHALRNLMSMIWLAGACQ